MSRLFSVAVVGGAVLAAACARNAQGVRESPQADQTYSVEIENQNFYSATVYAYRQGYRKRLGTVESHRTRSYSFTWPYTDIRFQVDFLAVGCMIGQSISVVEGDQYGLIIEPADHRRASRSLCGRGR